MGVVVWWEGGTGQALCAHVGHAAQPAFTGTESLLLTLPHPAATVQAPEIFEGSRATAPCDVYGFGMVRGVAG